MSFAFMVAEDARKLNATYIISVARKLGCTVFLLPEEENAVLVAHINSAKMIYKQ